MKRRRLHWPGILSALTTFVGLASLPEVLALLPKPASLVVIAVGAVLQAVTDPPVKPKAPAP